MVTEVYEVVDQAGNASTTEPPIGITNPRRDPDVFIGLG
jgi:hypothetical protein